MEQELYEGILQIQRGNTEELLSIIEKFKPLIQKYKRRLNYEESETDLTIALIEISLSLNIKNFDVNYDGPIVTFISNSMCNKSIDLFRKHILKKKEELELNFDIIGESIESAINNRLFIADLLSYLSEKQHFIIIQKYFKCRSETEIAKTLNISRQAVNKTKNEALRVLRANLINT